MNERRRGPVRLTGILEGERDIHDQERQRECAQESRLELNPRPRGSPPEAPDEPDEDKRRIHQAMAPKELKECSWMEGKPGIQISPGREMDRG